MFHTRMSKVFPSPFSLSSSSITRLIPCLLVGILAGCSLGTGASESTPAADSNESSEPAIAELPAELESQPSASGSSESSSEELSAADNMAPVEPSPEANTEANPSSDREEDSTAVSRASANTASAESTMGGDRSWRIISNRGILRVAVDPTIGYTYLRANPGSLTYEGFEWDILQEIAAELDIELEPMYVPWTDQLDALQEDRVDMILGGREVGGFDGEKFAATVPYYFSPQRIVVRDPLSGEIQHLSDLFGRKVGTVADSAGAAILEVFNNDRANALHLVSSSDPAHLFEQLRQGQVDAVVIDQPIAVAEVNGLRAALREDAAVPTSLGGEPDLPSQNNGETVSPGVTTLELDRQGTSSASHSEPGEDPDRLMEGDIELEEPRLSIAEEAIPTDIPLSIVGEPMFPTPLVGVVNVERISIKRAIDGAISQLESNGTITAILEKWEL